MNGGPVSRVPMEVKDVVMHVLMGHVGKDCAIRRSDLARQVASRLGLREYSPSALDRQCRDAIAELRRTDKLGANICSSTGTAGYYVAASRQELEEFLAQDERRGRNIFHRVAMQRKLALEGRKSWPLVQEEMF